MSVLGLVILIVLILLLAGALPQSGYASGYGPSGVVGLILIIVLILLLLGHI